MSAPTFVYVISYCGSDRDDMPVKVGITKTLGSRLASIQTGSFRKLQVAHHFWLPTRDLAVKAERQFHEDYAEERMAGEWFGMPAINALEGLCSIVLHILDDHYAEADLTLLHERTRVKSNFLAVLDYYGLPHR